ncbi:hypothetical protein SARC_14221 [Sphaeroforma arctica JP610]|uniref:Uncharacterized protein n=1 Tax=Sphaeroforma arctica JP610 TaxID=667725 RepID=A0A0L0F921_9EUKA|nr:hypothetical protein SARC_14221 [Sphaeroforma arctica JP610]KNC73219.1 hypothetical protein SARC_14221 [Sphaeroforma arctica JP610]|eukprot:XP_014147121.1 hypothetical protein SARC_14221 [Sphaeroforma arctica JP610]
MKALPDFPPFMHIGLLRWARYVALGSGLVYGFVHSRGVAKKEAIRVKHAEYMHVMQAKKDAEYADLVARANRVEGGVVTDPNDPAFDLDKLVAAYSK